MADPTGRRPRRITRSYGRGSILGLISPLVSFFMASRGFNGWQQRALQEMEDDAVAMGRQGYRVVSSEERSLPPFGIATYVVTYELVDPAG